MKREEKRIRTMETILEGAFSLLREKAWNLITSDELAKKANLTKRTLYAHYRSQDALYLHLVQTSFERFNRFIEARLKPNQTVRQTLMTVGRCYFMFYQTHPVEGRLIVSFDASSFGLEYHPSIEDIAVVANQYEPSRIFQRFGCDPSVYPPSLGLFLWSSLQGLLQLYDSKSNWLLEYYHTSFETMMDQQLHWIETVLPQETRNEA